MRLDQFEWSRNPRGLHVEAILRTPLKMERWFNPRMGWVKLIALGDEYVDEAQNFLANGVTPVLRTYRPRWGARPMDTVMRDQLLLYLRAGVKWFEIYNEPNLDVEWDGVDPDWRDLEFQIRPLMENWLNWAEYIISQGGYPGFPSLAESDDLQYASVRWLDAMLNYMATYQYDRFQAVLANGAYYASHPYIFNHFYQERPGGGPRSARPPEAQNAQEGGWHFEYPYDPICQYDDPGRTVYGGTALTPHGDPVGLLAMGRMFNERCATLFGTQAVPVVGTEGGIWPFRGGTHQLDSRYPPYNEQSQGEATVAMFEWIARTAPPWFFGVCLWKEDEYYNGGAVPAIQRMEQIAPVYKNVPPIEVMGSGFVPGMYGMAPGPGPIQGQATFHMILLAPGLSPDWFFETAQAYWNTFRPMVTTSVELIDLIPSDKSLAATVISSPDLVNTMTEQVQRKYPNVWFDLIVADDLARVRDTFNARVQVNRRFG